LFLPFHGRSRELFYFFAPLFIFSRLHSKRVLLLVVFFAFGDFILRPFSLRLYSKRVLFFVVILELFFVLFLHPFIFSSFSRRSRELFYF
jgi:hypothetical protein